MHAEKNGRSTTAGKVLILGVIATVSSLLLLLRHESAYIDSYAEAAIIIVGIYIALVVTIFTVLILSKLFYCFAKNRSVVGCIITARTEAVSLFGFTLLIPVVIAMLPFGMTLLIILYVAGFFERLYNYYKLRRAGKYALIVYSNSPRHKARVEDVYLPRFGESAVVMNWSERRRWAGIHGNFELRLAKEYFGLDIGILDKVNRRYARYHMSACLPGVAVFRPWYASKVYKLGVLFGNINHGKPEDLNRLEQLIFAPVE